MALVKPVIPTSSEAVNPTPAGVFQNIPSTADTLNSLACCCEDMSGGVDVPVLVGNSRDMPTIVPQSSDRLGTVGDRGMMSRDVLSIVTSTSTP